MFPNCAPNAINVGLQVAPPAIENPSQSVHFIERVPVFPKQ